MQSTNYLNQSNQQQQSTSNLNNNTNNFYSNSPQFGGGNNNNQQQQQQQFNGNNNSQYGNGSPMRNNNNNMVSSMNNNNNNNYNNNSSPFNSNNQSQYGAGSSSNQSQNNNNNSIQSTFGEKAKKNYLPGYLSGGALGAQNETAPLQNEDSRNAWDSPNSRVSMSGGSPIARFGNQSLFGNRDGTPSRSPQTNLYTQQPRTNSAYGSSSQNNRNLELEEDAPPVESLAEFEVGSSSSSGNNGGDSSMSGPSDNSYDNNRRPTLNSTASSSKPDQSSSTANSSQPQTYSLNLFGFPSSSLPLILEHFSQYGEILSSIPSTEGGNWVTITYSNPTSALRASRKNGMILGGILMIGVKIVDEEALKFGLGGNNNEIGNMMSSDITSTTTTTGSNNNSRPSTPSRGPPSGVGKPISVLQSNSAFRSTTTTTPTSARKSFFASGAAGINGNGNGNSVDPQAGLFAEKNRQALLAQGQSSGNGGVLSKVSEMVFGW